MAKNKAKSSTKMSERELDARIACLEQTANHICAEARLFNAMAEELELRNAIAKRGQSQ